MPAESTLNLLSTVSLFFAQQAAAKAEKLLGELVQREPPPAVRDIPASGGSAAAQSMGAGGTASTAGRAAGAAAATFAAGWAVANHKVPPATGIIPYVILEAAAELKVKTERRVFEGSNIALGVLLLPFHVLSCGLRAFGWARVMPESATPMGSVSDSADAQRLRFVQRELADLKAEISLIRQAAQAAPGAVSALALAAAPEHPAEAARSSPALRPLPPPPPPPPPPPAAQSAASASAVPSTPNSDSIANNAVSNTPADMDGKCDLMAAIRAAGGTLRKAALKPSQVPDDDTTETTPAKIGNGRPDMRSIVPTTPPTLRKVAEHSPGGTPMGTPRSPSTDASKSQIQDFLGSALRERSKRLRGISPDSEGAGLMRTDSDSSAWAPSPRTSPELPSRINVDAEISIAGQTKRKRQCSFTGIDQRNTPLSMSSPSQAKPAALPRTPHPVKSQPTNDDGSPAEHVGTPAGTAEETKAALQARVRTPAGTQSMADAPQPPLPQRPATAPNVAKVASETWEEGKDYY